MDSRQILASGSVPASIVQDGAFRTAPGNMALDEALASLAECLVIRAYRWDGDAYTYGYFTPYAEVANAVAGEDHTRRITGGGLVRHGGDLTLSIVVPVIFLERPVRSSCIYAWIHRSIGRVLDAAGIEVGLAAKRPTSSASSDCFEHPVESDLMLGGMKAMGGAIRKTARFLLYQGSLRLDDPPDLSLHELADSLGAGTITAAETISRDTLELASRLERDRYSAVGWKHLR